MLVCAFRPIPPPSGPAGRTESATLSDKKLTGALGCSTEAGTASGRVGSREAEEPAFFEIEATDGGHGGGAARDSFVFTVFFEPEQAPLNHAIFGPNPAFTGEMIAGEITIAPPAVLPLIAGTPMP